MSSWESHKVGPATSALSACARQPVSYPTRFSQQRLHDAQFDWQLIDVLNDITQHFANDADARAKV
jgi:hypothetical protein